METRVHTSTNCSDFIQFTSEWEARYCAGEVGTGGIRVIEIPRYLHARVLWHGNEVGEGLFSVLRYKLNFKKTLKKKK